MANCLPRHKSSSTMNFTAANMIFSQCPPPETFSVTLMDRDETSNPQSVHNRALTKGGEAIAIVGLYYDLQVDPSLGRSLARDAGI